MSPVSYARHSSLHHPSKMADAIEFDCDKLAQAILRNQSNSYLHLHPALPTYKRYIWNFKECDFIPLFIYLVFQIVNMFTMPTELLRSFLGQNNSTRRVRV